MEFVYVAPREALFPTCTPQGFQPFRTPEEAGAMLALLASEGFFVERERAERTPAWKQAIPYCVVANDEGVLLMKRRSRGGEKRLHDKLSIGVGGHINPVDVVDDDLVLAAARREIEEEIDVAGAVEPRLVGYLNDDTNPVGAVHVGLVFVAITDAAISIREEDVLEGRMVTADELRAAQARGDDFETWSSILIAHLDELGLVRQTATT